MTLVHSRASRHQHIVDLLARTTVRSQAELVELLAGDGFAVTQATLSRDLDELGATKVRDDEGRLVYAVPGEGGDLTPRAVPDQVADLDRLRRRCAEHSGKLLMRGSIGQGDDPREEAHACFGISRLTPRARGARNGVP